MARNHTHHDGGPLQRAAQATAAGLFEPFAAPPLARDPEPPALAEEKCTTCGATCTYVCNVDTGRRGPADLRRTSAVYVIFTPGPPNGRGELPAMTAAKFLARVDRIVMKDGTTVDPAGLAFQVSHFATCPSAKFHSHK